MYLQNPVEGLGCQRPLSLRHPPCHQTADPTPVSWYPLPFGQVLLSHLLMETAKLLKMTCKLNRHKLQCVLLGISQNRNYVSLPIITYCRLLDQN